MKIYLISLCIALMGAFSIFANNAVVKVKTSDCGKEFHGSGFIISKEGYILTIASLLLPTIAVCVPYLESSLDVTLVDIYPNLNIALLKLTDSSLQRIKARLGCIPYLKLDNSDSYLAQGIIALGYPLGSNKIHKSAGTIISKIIDKNDINCSVYHIGVPSVNIHFYFSPVLLPGGPVINFKNKVVGVSSDKFFTEGDFITVCMLPINPLKLEIIRKAIIRENVKISLEKGIIPWLSLPQKLQKDSRETVRIFV